MTPRYPVMSAQHTVIPAKAGIPPSRRGAPCGRPSLRPLPLWGRLREGARRQARERPWRAPPPASPPNGDPCATRPHPSFPRKRESIPPSGLSPSGEDLREGARFPASSPPGDLCKLRRGEDRRPLALGKGGGAGSYPLSRWERVGVRAGGGGGRATLLKPARRVTQRSPPGRRLR